MNIGFIGMGTMGAPMAKRLVEAGYQVTVHNRTRSREEPVAAAGAHRAASPREAAFDKDVVITMVSDTPDVQAVVLGEQGAIHGMKAGSVLVDMSTISPSATRKIAKALSEKDIEMLDAPVSGGSEGAEKGTLSIMVGGKDVVLEQIRPVLEHLGSTITLVGPVGSGQVTKAINQVIIAGAYGAVAEGMALGLAAGIDLEAAHRALSGGAAGSWILTNRAQNMIENRYPLGFRTRLHRKDLNIALDAAKELGVAIPISAYIEQLETSLVKRGFGEEDVSNIARIVREQAGLE
ncbi:MAG: NAD(P)-dependent oxidoreductase [Trueperaceae bacterium]|nr:MAG: NAD(P)-dependent oxidoreductase [Trueperaceae bacterium]